MASLRTLGAIALALALALSLAGLAAAQPPAGDPGPGDDPDLDEPLDAPPSPPSPPEPPEPPEPLPPEPLRPEPLPPPEPEEAAAQEEPAAEEDGAGPGFALAAHFFTRYELRAHQDQVGGSDADHFRFRTRLGLVTDRAALGESLEGALRFVPQATGQWQLAGLADAALGLHEGVLELYAGDVRLEAGRFEMTYGEHLLIGNVGWHPTGRAFDGARVRFGTGAQEAWVDAFFTATAEGSPTTDFGSGDTWFTGVYAALGPHLAEKLALDAYALALVTPATSVTVVDPMTMLPVTTELDAGVRFTLGSRFKHRFGPVDVRAEAGLQVGSDPRVSGSDRSVMAFQGDLEAGVNLMDDKLRVAVEGLYASGDDPTTADTNEGWNQLFPTAHKWLGWADIIGFGGGLNGAGRSNLLSGALHVAASAGASLQLTLDGHVFMRAQDVALPMMMTVVDERYVGAEVDLGATYTLGTGLKLRAGYALFLPHEDYWGTGDPAHFLEVELGYTQ